MPSFAPAPETPPTPPEQAADAPRDGWRAELPALRAELDRIDDALLELLIERAAVVERVARTAKPAAFRPGRQAAIIRRLLHAHRGGLPPGALVRIWLELFAGTTAMQGPFAVVVWDPSGDASYTQAAREHFGALTPLRSCSRPGLALAEVTSGAASVAVLPFPEDGGPGPDAWWTMLRPQKHRAWIAGRLPFWIPRPEGAPNVQALVITPVPPDPSGDDRSLASVEMAGDISRTSLAARLKAAGLDGAMIASARDGDGGNWQALVEVNGWVNADDERLAALNGVLLGAYAVPLAGDPE